jgi:NAD(P)-dependent dehydrogenase (short-subunit alcohol dehydrogenase family)
MRLDDQAIVVTGAGNGIGAAYAHALAAAGAAVVVDDIDAPAADAVAAAIRSAGGRAVTEARDVRDAGDAQALIDRCIAEYGRITGLCNNAGLMIPNLLTEAEAGDLRAMLETNVLGTFHCTRAAVAPMLEQGFGSIVNITSGSQTGQRANGGYGASKGAVATFTYAWAAELAGTGVRVNAISPMAHSPMSIAMEAYQRARGVDFRAADLPAPEANAPLAVFLMSERAAGVTGQVLRIDGTRFALMAHPAIRTPVLERDRWTPDDVADAFDEVLRDLVLPVDVARYDIERVW